MYDDDDDGRYVQYLVGCVAMKNLGGLCPHPWKVRQPRGLQISNFPAKCQSRLLAEKTRQRILQPRNSHSRAHSYRSTWYTFVDYTATMSEEAQSKANNGNPSASQQQVEPSSATTTANTHSQTDTEIPDAPPPSQSSQLPPLPQSSSKTIAGAATSSSEQQQQPAQAPPLPPPSTTTPHQENQEEIQQQPQNQNQQEEEDEREGENFPYSPPLPPKHTPITPGPRASRLQDLFSTTLRHTLDKVNGSDNFGACFPTISAKAPGTLEFVRRQMVERLRGLCEVCFYFCF